MNKPNADLILSTKEVCEILGVSKMYISILVKKGKLIPLRKFDREFIWWKPDIGNFKKQRGR